MGDAASLAALALVGGFTFVEWSNLTRYHASRAEGQRLFFYAAAVAIILVITARLILVTLSAALPHTYGALRTALWAFVPGTQQQPWLATALIVPCLGLIAAYVSNLIVDSDAASSRVIERKGTELEKLLLTAFAAFPALVAISLKSGKVYIGWPSSVPPILETETEYIRLLPAISGYRKPPEMTLELTTDYVPVYEAIRNGTLPPTISGSDFDIVIPTSEIVSANLFSLELDRAMFRPAGSQQGPAADDPTKDGG